MKRATQAKIAEYIVLKISIHALVKRATREGNAGGERLRNFNPRPREEGDSRVLASVQFLDYFNPRPREEGDPFMSCIAVDQNHFNPRPREEGDPVISMRIFTADISIHALVKRATHDFLT